MTADIVTAMIGVTGAVALAGASYWFTKQRERDAELRREKLEHYKEFVATLSGTIAGEATPEGHRAFALACNKLNLIASQPVLKALQEFQNEIRISNTTKSQSRHDRLMSVLFYEIRKDLSVTPKDDASTFMVGLCSSGIPPVTN